MSPWWVSYTALQGWLSECIAPSPFWNAVAPMLEATCMWARAARSAPSSQAAASHSFTSRIPSSAMPCAIGWKTGEQYASRLWERASMPTAAVMRAGSPVVSSGSATTATGIIIGWKMIFLVWSRVSVITDARPTSEPVPEVVGTATTGAIPPGSARVHQSSRSSKSQIGRICPDISATAFAASSALPPPNPITPSWPPSRKARTPSVTFGSTGFARTSEKTSQPSCASRHDSTASLTIDIAASAGSVTSRGRVIPASRHACASSRIRPGPKRIEVG